MPTKPSLVFSSPTKSSAQVPSSSKPSPRPFEASSPPNYASHSSKEINSSSSNKHPSLTHSVNNRSMTSRTTLKTYKGSENTNNNSEVFDNSFTFESPKKHTTSLSSSHDLESSDKKRKLDQASTSSISSPSGWKTKPSKKLKDTLPSMSDDKKPFSHKEVKPKSKRTKFIIGVTGGDFIEKGEVVNIIKKLSKNSEYNYVEIGGSDCEKFTHLVCLDENPKKTLKLIYSIALNIPILKSSWLYESDKASYFVSESEFYITNYLRKRPSGGVLKDKRCFVLRGDTVSLPSPEICERFIELCGGTIVEKITQANIIITTSSSNELEYIIPRHDISSLPMYPVVTMRWIVDVVDKQQLLDTKEYRDEYYYSLECINKEKEILKQTSPSHIACLRLTSTLDCTAPLIPLYMDKKVVTLGRAATDVDHVIDTPNSKKNPVISRIHAKIVQIQENSSQSEDKVIRWKLIDSSSNGTFVNNTKVKEVFLVNGDVIAFGHNKANVAVGEKVPFVHTKCIYVFETEEIVNTEDVQKEKEELQKENEKMRQEIQRLRESHMKTAMSNIQKEKEIIRLQNLVRQNQRRDSLEFPFNHKLYIIDTNVLVERLHILKTLLEKVNCSCIIPQTVISELDKLKLRKDMCGTKARDAIRFLEESFEKRKYENLYGQQAHQTLNGMEDGGVQPQSADDHIINCCLYFKDKVLKRKEKNHELILLTYDRNMRIKSGINKIYAPSNFE